MNNYESLGFFDFEDFVEELTDEQLFAINGGGCGGGFSGGGHGPTGGGGCSGGSPSGGYGPTGGGSCGGGYNPSSKTPSVPTIPSCGGGAYHSPSKQVCTNPNADHCDIYAWNLAIDNGLDPRKGLQTELNLNWATVDQMYNFYYKGKSKSFNSTAAGKKGMLVYDWGGTTSAKDHIEYVEVSSDGKGYTLYKTNGVDAPKSEYRYFSSSPNARADVSKGSSVTFIPLN